MKGIRFSLLASLAAETNAVPQTAPQVAVAKEFNFGGGELTDFVSELGKTFGVDLFKIATIPDHMRSVRVPKMRVTTESFAHVLRLYNSTSSESDGSMGKWIMKSLGANSNFASYSPDFLPDILLLTGKNDESNQGKHFAIKAFAFKELSDAQLSDLRDIIHGETDMLYRQMRSSGDVNQLEIQGNLHYHKNAGILVVSGGGLYTETAATIIEAFRLAAPSSSANVAVPQKK